MVIGCARLNGSRRGVGLIAEVNAFGEVQGRCQVGKLCERQRYFLNPVLAGIELFYRHTIIEGCDGDVVLTVRCGIIDKGDDGCVKFVLDRKHVCQRDRIGGSSQERLLESGGLFAIVPNSGDLEFIWECWRCVQFVCLLWPF